MIVTYNSLHVIGDLLDSLPKALDGLTADIVVVDNGSSDGTAELVAALGVCRIVRSANVGYAAGINRGVREAAPAQAILVLNPDVRLHPGSLPPLLAALAEPRVGIAAPRVLTPQGKLHLSLRREPTLPRALGLTRTRLAVFSEYVYDPSAYTRPCTVDWALGAALLTSRECYEALGGWDETYFLYSEETDLSLRARDAGLLTRYEPRAVAVHIGGQSGRSHRTTPCRSSTGCGCTGAATARSRPGPTTGSSWPTRCRESRAGGVSPGMRLWRCSGQGAARPNWAARAGACHGNAAAGQRGAPGLTDPDTKCRSCS